MLSAKRVLVAGCGGLGGYVLEFLGRVGVGHLTAVDGDVFSDSNLNRQLLSTTGTLDRQKPLCAQERMHLVNPAVSVTPVCSFITEDNVAEIVQNHDVIVDALDNGPTRILLARQARALGIPVVSGAISGWSGRVFILTPDDNADFLWSGGQVLSAGNLCFTASCVASVQAAETVKVLLGRSQLLQGRFLELNLLSGQWEDIPIDLRF